MDTIQDVLIYQTQMMRNSSLGPYVQPDFSPPEYIVLVNALFYASLGIMLLAAFIAMLIKSWVREFDRGLTAISIPEQRAKTREFRYLGMERWKLQEMVALLPLLIQISLLLFAIGLVLFLFHISKPSFGVTTAIFGVSVLYYAITTIISVFVTSSPFHSPLSRALGRIYQYVHAYSCPELDDFDMTSGTYLGRFRLQVQIFFQTTRPYLESDFVEPITATTVDDVQLSTAASALQRIHDSVPNSQHSLLIQQSVWQIAGSPALRMRPLTRLPSWILDRGNDKEFFSRLSPVNAVALTAVFVRMRDPRYKKRILGLADIRRGVSDFQTPWAELVHAIFRRLPDEFTYEKFLRDYYSRRALSFDALLLRTLPDVPSLNALRNRILRETLHDINSKAKGIMHRRFPHKYPWRALYRHSLPLEVTLNRALFDALDNALYSAPLRVVHTFLRDALGNSRLDEKTAEARLIRVFVEPEEPGDILNILRANELNEEEAMWLLSTLSGLHCDGLVLMRPRVFLAILLHQTPKWNWMTPPNVMLLEAVVTLSAISSSSNETYQMKTLTNSHQYPWLLLNLRNPALLRKMIDEIDDSWREELISLLFLVIYALTLRGSKFLAEQYLAVITAKADFTLCASALTALAPALGDDGFSAIGRLLLAPQVQFSTPAACYSMSNNTADLPQLGRSHQDLFNNYDCQLGTSEFPDSRIAAILLLLFKDWDFELRWRIPHPDIDLKNAWLQCVADVILPRSLPNGPRMDMWSFHDHRVQNMSAALSLLQYINGNGDYHLPREIISSPLFLESSEPTICCMALCFYLDTIPPPPSYDLSGAIRVVFNPILPNPHLSKGWEVLRVFMSRFEHLSVGSRQTIAKAFFTLSRRPLLKGNSTSSSKQELREILTWEYFCREEHKPKLTDAEFSGLDWMAAVWSLHLFQQPNSERDWVNEHFVLRVLGDLLHSAPYYSIIPIVPRLREFVGGFDNLELSEPQNSISASIEGVLYRQQECKTLFRYQKFHCMWYI